MAVGKRIYLRRDLPDQKIVEQLGKIPTANTADVMNRSCGMDPRIRLMSKPKASVTSGVALTVKTCAGDNLTLHAALNMAQKGDFIVVANEGGSARSLMGDIMMAYLRFDRKIAGIVLDGPIRDIDEISQWDFPVYATGTNPGGPYKNGPGEINVSVSCGNITVHAGDIIVADADGVIVVPRKDAAVILEDAKKFQAADDAKLEAAKNGRAKREWVDKALIEQGYEIIDDKYNG